MVGQIIEKLKAQRGQRYISGEADEMREWCMEFIWRGNWDFMFEESEKTREMRELAKEVGFWPWLHVPLYPDHHYTPLVTLSDLFFYIRFFERFQPKTILELGTAGTGTAHMFSWLFEDLKVIGVDIDEKALEHCAYLESVRKSNVEVVVSDANEIFEELVEKYRPDLVIIDYEHKYESSIRIAKWCVERGINFAIHDVNCEVEEALAAAECMMSPDLHEYFKTASACGIFFGIPGGDRHAEG